MINVTNQTHADFGYGDILVGSFLCTDPDGLEVGMLTLKNSEPHEIGSNVMPNDDEDPFDVPVIFTFRNVKSLDVVIEHLNHIRNDMLSVENKENE